MFKARYTVGLSDSNTIPNHDFLERFKGLDIRERAINVGPTGLVNGLEPNDTNVDNTAGLAKIQKMDPDAVLQELTQVFSTMNLNQKSTNPTKAKEQLTEIINEITKHSPKTNVNWSSIGGYTETKQKLSNFIKNNLIDPTKYLQYGLQTSKGLLLHGPSGFQN
jgi:SpoVK/Ycf46/Vps4 family AAA+-type ATPase